MKKLTSVLVLAFLAGCSASPSLTTQPVEVTDNMQAYWEPTSNKISFTTYTDTQKFRPKGYVKIQFLIDSDGQVFNPRVIESEPQGVWDDVALSGVKALQYTPAEENPSLTPIYTSHTFHFSMEKPSS